MTTSTSYYFDANAVVKLYTLEPGTAWVRQLLANQDHTIYINSVCIAEVAAALSVLRRTGRISRDQQLLALDEFYADIDCQLAVLDVTIEIARFAAVLTLHYPLKGYDAIHLATTLSLANDLRAGNLSLTLITGDNQMIHAAQAEALPTANPFDYAHLDQSEPTQ